MPDSLVKPNTPTIYVHEASTPHTAPMGARNGQSTKGISSAEGELKVRQPYDKPFTTSSGRQIYATGQSDEHAIDIDEGHYLT